MALFGKKKEKQTPVQTRKEEQKVGLTWDILYTPNFRGTKRTKLVTYGNDLTAKGLKALDGVDLTGKTITVQEFFFAEGKGLSFKIDGNQIGCIFSQTNEATIELFTSGAVEKLHVEMKHDNPLEPDRISTYIFTKKQE